jgi:hypothetical protein
VLRVRCRVRALSPLLLLTAALSAAAEPAVRLDAGCPSDANDTCFSDLSTLDHWLWQTRRPSAAAPVIVQVGAGEFRGRLDCHEQGHVTFRGVGRAQSKLVGTVDEFPFATIRTDRCTGLAFEHLTVLAPHSGTGRGKAVRWSGGGDSRWSDVELRAEYVAWYDSGCPHGNTLPPLGAHRFERVSLHAGALGFFSDCSEARLDETEIVVAPTADTPLMNLGGGLVRITAGVKASHRADVQLSRCEVRVDGTGGTSVGAVIGLLAGPDGNEHPLGAGSIEMDGGELSVRGKAGERVLDARAERFGFAGARAARIRVRGVTLAAPARSAGDGIVDWSAGR